MQPSQSSRQKDHLNLLKTPHWAWKQPNTPYQQKTHYQVSTTQLPLSRVQARRCLPKLLHQATRLCSRRLRSHHHRSKRQVYQRLPIVVLHKSGALILHTRYLTKATCPLKMPRLARVTMARTPVARRRSRAKKKPSEEMTEEEIREKH